jgi:hypothetical protein
VQAHVRGLLAIKKKLAQQQKEHQAERHKYPRLLSLSRQTVQGETAKAICALPSQATPEPHNGLYGGGGAENVDGESIAPTLTANNAGGNQRMLKG